MNLKFRLMDSIFFLVLFTNIMAQTDSDGFVVQSNVTSITQPMNFVNRTYRDYRFGRNQTHYDHFNATSWRINDTTASYWKKAPYFYNGTHYWNGTQVVYCAPFTNSSNGTNCSFIYGDAFLKGIYDDNTPNCQVQLMQSYGFEGHSVSNQTTVPMCNHIQYSCCTPEDQLWMQRSWVRDGNQLDMRNKMEYFNNTYKEFLEALGQAATAASGIGSKLFITNNCKVLANTIAQFDTLDVFYNLGQLAKNHFSYHGQMFESFYCTLCDAEAHQFFDLTKQRIIYNHRHCKDITQNTLTFLLYFHVHLVKIVNLLVDFVASCDAFGNYNKVVIDESLFKLQVDRKLRRELLRCRTQRNKKGWYGACLPICRRYSMTKLRNFFLPNFKKMSPIASFIKGNIQIIKNQAMNLILNDQVAGNKNAQIRMLAVQEKITKRRRDQVKRSLQQNNNPSSYNTKILRTLRNNHLERVMIPGALGQTVNVHRLRPAFRSIGLQPMNISAAVDLCDRIEQVVLQVTIAEQYPTYNSTSFSLYIGGMSGAYKSLPRNLVSIALSLLISTALFK